MANPECIPNYNPQRFQFVRICECGCNTPTQIAKSTSLRKGHVKGEPYRFASRHYRKPRRHQGYPEQGSGRAKNMIHRIRAERALGHPLPSKAQIHHPDEDPWNPNARLIICENQAYHSMLHRFRRVQLAGGNPFRHRICIGCRELKIIEDFTIHRDYAGGRDAYCRACKNARMAAAYRRRKARVASVIDSQDESNDTNV